MSNLFSDFFAATIEPVSTTLGTRPTARLMSQTNPPRYPEGYDSAANNISQRLFDAYLPSFCQAEGRQKAAWEHFQQTPAFIDFEAGKHAGLCQRLWKCVHERFMGKIVDQKSPNISAIVREIKEDYHIPVVYENFNKISKDWKVETVHPVTEYATATRTTNAELSPYNTPQNWMPQTPATRYGSVPQRPLSDAAQHITYGTAPIAIPSRPKTLMRQEDRAQRSADDVQLKLQELKTTWLDADIKKLDLEFKVQELEEKVSGLTQQLTDKAELIKALEKKYAETVKDLETKLAKARTSLKESQARCKELEVQIEVESLFAITSPQPGYGSSGSSYK
ncbi:hypothetical protein N0V90_000603 [Kalmusia sp. IMI 367209]|nr:hypothetical protein N0V90_000603 [Kalmusia sp. IMI 367209]